MAFITDTFTESSDVDLSSHTGEGGVTWTDHPHANYIGSFTVDAATDRIWGNSTAAYYASGVPFSADYSFEADFYLHSAISQNVAICVRVDTTDDTMVIARLNNGTIWEIREIVNGVATTLGSSTNQLPSVGTSKRGRLEVRGNQAFFLVDGVLEIGPVTLTITAAGRVGVRNAGTATASTGIHLDNLSASALDAGASLFRGRSFLFFDDEQVNRFEFWPVAAGVTDLPLTLSDDVASLADSLNKVGGQMKTLSDDAFNLADALTQAVEHRIPLSDNANILADSEVRVLGIESSTSDTLVSFTDAHIQLLAHLLTLSDNTANLNDSAVLDLEQYEEFTDSFALSDTGVVALGYEIALVDDAATLADDYTQIQGQLASLADSFTLVDTLEPGYGLLTSDALVLSDTENVVLGHLVEFDDAFVLADSESHALGHDELLSDVIALSDAQSLELGQLLEFADDIDNLSDAHALLLDYLLSLSDSHVVSDTVALLLVHLLSLNDDANLLADFIEADAPQALRQVGVADSADNLTDAVTLQLDYLLDAADTIALTDSFALEQGILVPLADNAANWADSLAKTTGIPLILNDNAASLADDYAVLLVHLLGVSDSFALTDVLATFGENYLQVADALVLADDVGIELRGPELDAVIADTLVLTDAVALSLRDQLQYQIVLTDTITLYDHYFDLRHPYIPSARRHVVVPSRARTTKVPTSDRETVPAGSRTTKVP